MHNHESAPMPTPPSVARTLILFAAASMLTATTVSAAVSTPEAIAEAKAAIWAKEQKIYRDRGTGSMAYYAANTSENYLGWPPTTAKPFPRQALPQNTTNIVGNKEKIDTELVDFTLDGDTALIYYINHRTSRGDGSPVDERFSNIHVWIKRNGEWILLGGMARPTMAPIK